MTHLAMMVPNPYRDGAKEFVMVHSLSLQGGRLEGHHPCRAPLAPRLLPLLFFALLGMLPAAHARAQTILDLVDNGGPVMQARHIHLIFWLPSGKHFDSSGKAADDTTYESLMSRFFNDLSGSGYANIMTEYPGTCAPPTIAATSNCVGSISVAGTSVDSAAYTTGAGTSTSPLSDADMQAEIQRYITANSITPDLTTAFFVFLGNGVVECSTGIGCDNTAGGFCAYHSSFTATGGGTVIYGVMPNLDSLSGCDEGISSGPNRLAADREIIALSHEYFEMVTDPLVNVTGAWFDPGPTFREVGDNCNPSGTPQLGTLASNGSNVTMNGNAYVVQAQWSNDSAGCLVNSVNSYAGPTIETRFTTGSDDLRGNSSLGATLADTAGSTGGALGKYQAEPGWNSGSIHVRVVPNPFSAPLKSERLDLTSHSDFLQTNDHWDLQALQVTVRNANGTTVCQQTASGTPLASITDGAPMTLPTQNCVPAPPVGEAVQCKVFDDGYSNLIGPSDAIFVSGRTSPNERGKSCIPGGTFGQCRKWMGRCETVTTHSPVTFQVFNDGNANPSVSSDAVYIPANGNSACIPDGTSTGLCRRWFGEGRTADGRAVSCTVFDDGYANQSPTTGAVYVPSPIPGAGKACMPDGTPGGLCRRWWGRCATQ